MASPTTPPVDASPRVIACSLHETVLLSNAGDILVARDARETVDDGLSSTALSCFDDDISRQLRSESICGPWEKQGLLGGSEVVATRWKPDRPPLVPVGYSPIRRNHPPTSTMAGDPSPSKSLADWSAASTDEQEATISLIQSFDYSQFYEDGNGMLPGMANKQADAPETRSPEDDERSHESQTFLYGIPTFCKEFSNIKIGAVSAHPLGSHTLFISKAGLLYSYGNNLRGQLGIGVIGDSNVRHPTIVTPLLENGGKAMACAAGVWHSLVVVENRNGQDQVYGFGRHDVLGLVRPQRSDVTLPRRVQLRGSTKIAASRDHSAAIQHDGTLYVWSSDQSPAPMDLHGEVAVDVSLGPSSTLVVTESGSCFAAGSSDCGMLGVAGTTEADRFLKVNIPEGVRGVSAGVSSAVAWSETGRAYTWGDGVDTPQPMTCMEMPVVQAAAGRDCLLFVSKNGTVSSCGKPSGRLGQGRIQKEVTTPKPLYGGLRLWYCED